MKIEFEAKFINIDINKLIQQIKHLGGKQNKPRRLMKRCTFDIPDSPRGTFIRVRDEGNTITLTYKRLQSLSLSGMKEIEVKIDNFKNMISFLKAIGMRYATYEENYRESYKLNGVEITVDEWPGLPKFIEIEGKTEKAVKQIIKKLKLPFKQALYGNVDEVYKQLKNIDISKCKNITFDKPPIN